MLDMIEHSLNPDAQQPGLQKPQKQQRVLTVNPRVQTLVIRAMLRLLLTVFCMIHKQLTGDSCFLAINVMGIYDL